MSVELPDYVALLPDNFKVVVNPTASDALSMYSLNPLLLTAYLLNISTANSVEHTIVDFDRTSRISDTILSAYDLYSPEIYKGFLAFKSTFYDIIYLLRQLGLDAQIVESAPSGLLDRGNNDKLIDGTWYIGNPTNVKLSAQTQYGDPNYYIGGGWPITNPTNIINVNPPAQTQYGNLNYYIGGKWPITNPTNSIYIRPYQPPLSLPLNEDHSIYIRPYQPFLSLNEDPYVISQVGNNCELELIVNVSSYTASGVYTNLSNVYNEVARVLINRLNVLVILAKITINLSLTDSVTGVTDELSAQYARPFLIENLITEWRIGDGHIINRGESISATSLTQLEQLFIKNSNYLNAGLVINSDIVTNITGTS